MLVSLVQLFVLGEGRRIKITEETEWFVFGVEMDHFFLFLHSKILQYNNRDINISFWIVKDIILIQLMSFLNKLWKDLAEKMKNQTAANPPKEFKQVYKGYRTIPIQSLTRKQVNQVKKDLKGEDLWKNDSNQKIFTYMENVPITNRCSNGFFDSFYNAYMRHGDIKIKPDDVWMVIMIWFTEYVNDNSKQLRHAFVKHKGKMMLAVQTQGNLQDWVPFLNKVIQQIQKNTFKGVVEKLKCNFTTSGLFEQLFSTAVIMNTCKKYFKYVSYAPACGIVNAHMAGTLEDWQNLEKKLLNLEHFDVNGELKKYVRGLRPVLQQFTETYKGNANIEFWNNIYIERKAPYMGPYFPNLIMNGWLIKFFTISNQMSQVDKLNILSVPIKYVNYATKQQKNFILRGGCKGYSCIDDYVYTPHYSFAITINEEKEEEEEEEEEEDEEEQEENEGVEERSQMGNIENESGSGLPQKKGKTINKPKHQKKSLKFFNRMRLRSMKRGKLMKKSAKKGQL